MRISVMNYEFEFTQEAFAKVPESTEFEVAEHRCRDRMPVEPGRIADFCKSLPVVHFAVHDFNVIAFAVIVRITPTLVFVIEARIHRSRKHQALSISSALSSIFTEVRGVINDFSHPEHVIDA